MSAARRLTVATLCALVGGLVLSSAPALAAAPEAPVTGAANPVTTTTATLNGEVEELNPENALEVGTYEFLYRESATVCEGGKTAPVPAGIVLSKETESQPLSGLLPGTTYTFCLLARNAAGETALGAPVTFTTHGAGITEEQATGVEATAATLQADIDPNESSTSYHFEYDTSPYTSSAPHGTSLPVPSEAIGSGTSRVPVSVRVTGLQPGATYYYRVVAVDETETFDGPGKALTTPTAPVSGSSGSCPNEQLRAEQPYGLGLPDCRAYELVSPADANGQDATDSFVVSSRAAVSGEAIVFASRGSFADPAGSFYENQFLSRRGPGGWSTQSITPPYEAYEIAALAPFETMAFTPELSEGVVETDEPLAGEPPAGHYESYLDDFANGSYQWLSNVPQNMKRQVYTLNRFAFTMGTSTDLSRVVFSGVEEGSVSVYEWVEGEVTPIPVSVANSGEPMSAHVGVSIKEGAGNVELVPVEADTWHAVSSDGSRVFFTTPGSGEAGQLYLRDNVEQPQSEIGSKGECEVAADACTVEVSASQRATEDPHGPQWARYWGASADGSKVFFTSRAELTEDAYTGLADNAANLYECELMEEEAGHKIPLRCDLKDLTVDRADAAEGAAVQGVVQISEDGSYVYFVARGDLAGDAKLGQPNLYVSHDGGAPTFIATLAADDETDWNGDPSEGGYGSGPITNRAVVTLDGTRLAFMSSLELTGYDNHDANTGALDSEIYLYDAETGGLVCASCDPSGARPVGPSRLVGLTGSPVVKQADQEYRLRNLLESGVLFFDSEDALVPHASDGHQNVYEYEDGHVYPISNVAGGQESFFLDASASGNDVFFGTAEPLVSQDQGDDRVAVYDARVDGGFPAVVVPSACDNGDSCKPPASPQPAVFGAPSSATFSGAGNVGPVAAAPPPKKVAKKTVRCQRGFVKSRRSKCVRRKPKKHRARKSAHIDGRAK